METERLTLRSLVSEDVGVGPGQVVEVETVVDRLFDQGRGGVTQVAAGLA